MPIVGGSLTTTRSSTTLAEFIDEALAYLYQPMERPAQVVMGSDALDSGSDTTCTLVGDIGPIQVSTVLELGQELVLVTERSETATPVFTVARGYAGTPAVAHAAGEVVLIQPLWPRFEVRRAVLRAFRGPLATQLPNLVAGVLTPVANKSYVEMPGNTIEVFRVGLNEGGRWTPINQWEFEEDVHPDVVSTGKILSFPTSVSPSTPLYVTYQVPYDWSGGTANPGESETMSMLATAEDLPSLYAAAWRVFGREISRSELDRTEEWNNEAAIRQGVNLRLAQALWGQFYRRLEEARRVINVPRHRPFRKMSRR